jgi:hypothetical protein
MTRVGGREGLIKHVGGALVVVVVVDEAPGGNEDFARVNVEGNVLRKSILLCNPRVHGSCTTMT